MPRENCIVCSAPVDVLAAINDAIRKREKFRTLASRTGYSRASLHRHSQGCIPREIVAAHRSTKYVPQTDRVLVQFDPEKDAYEVRYDPLGASKAGTTITASELRARDVVIVVTYAKSPITNPSAGLDTIANTNPVPLE